MPDPVRTGTTTAFDGTHLQYQVFGSGPPVVVANGIGVRYQGLVHQVEHLQRRFTLITWDYRGLYDSGPPGYGGVTVYAQARDCMAVMDACGVAQAGFLGWSMGVQVGFEVMKLDMDRFSRMACLSGGPCSPFRANLFLRDIHRLMPPLVDFWSRFAPAVSPFAPGIVEHPAFYRAAQEVRFIRTQADRDAFLEMAAAIAQHDHKLYLRTLAELGRHDATYLVPQLSIPLLFLVGAKDTLISPRFIKKTAFRAPNCRLHVIPGGSHFVTIEQADQVNDIVESFLTEPSP